jgi:hypothetical protein
MIPAFYAMTLYLGASLASSIWNGTMAANPTARPHWTLKAFIICEGLAFCYGLPLLGLAENFAPKPFANLRVHGGNGTNHFFAPTNLGASLGIPIPSQEVVRVESTTSDRLNALWPAEMSFYLLMMGTLDSSWSRLVTLDASSDRLPPGSSVRAVPSVRISEKMSLFGVPARFSTREFNCRQNTCCWRVLCILLYV